MRRHGYLFRQMVWLILAIALPLFTLLVYNVERDAERARAVAYQTVANYASSIAQEAEVLLAEAENYLEFMARRPLVMALTTHAAIRCWRGWCSGAGTLPTSS